MYFIFTFYGSYECHALIDLAFVNMLILFCANKHGWMDLEAWLNLDPMRPQLTAFL